MGLNPMNHHSKEQRQVAARAFLESLEQLGEQIRAEPTVEPSPSHSHKLTMDELEEAVTDIEHLLQDETPTP